MLSAASSGHAAVVSLLLEGGASIDLANDAGSTALWKAAANGHMAVVSRLLEGGASVDLAAKDGTTPLLVAERMGRQAVVSRLRAAMEQQLGGAPQARPDFERSISQLGDCISVQLSPGHCRHAISLTWEVIHPWRNQWRCGEVIHPCPLLTASPVLSPAIVNECAHENMDV